MENPTSDMPIGQEKNNNSTDSLNRIDFEKELEKYGIGKESEEIETNLFPVEVFPLPIQKIIHATNENLNFPTDFIGTSILSAASISIGNTHKIEIKRGFLESAVLYTAIVAPPGTNKSHPLHFAMQPIIEEDKKSFKKYEEERKEYERVSAISKIEREKQGITDPPKPFWQKHLLTDFTPEALVQVHKTNKRGIGVYVDELAGWFKNFNRYNKGSEVEFWLSAWNSKPINIDRKTGEPVFIPLPFITVAGTIQNGLLNDLAKDSRMLNGFIDRILFAIPDNIQKPYWDDTEIDQSIIDSWHKIIFTLLKLPIHVDETSNPCPEILRFSPNAKRLLFKWQRTNTDQCNREKNEIIKGIYSKLEMYAIRLALILEMLRWACNESGKHEISLESVEGALRLVQYFQKAAIKVYSIISSSSPLKTLSSDKLKLYEILPDFFTTDKGIEMAKSVGVSERTFKRFLNEKELFVRTRWGEYQKF